MKNKIFIGFSVFIIIQSALYLSNIYAQGNFRERIRDRIKERLKERTQTYDSGDHEFSLVHEGITRKYNVHLPQSYNEKIPTPVVIYLHGGGGSIKAAYNEGIDKTSDKHGFILVISAGTGPIPDRSLYWNAGYCCTYASENNIDDVGYISKIIDEVKSKFNVDEKRIYATGISNGAAMSYRLACELSDKISAVAVVSPPFTFLGCNPSKSVSIMHIHGTADPCATFEGGTGTGCFGKAPKDTQSAKEMVDSWLKLNNCSAEAVNVYQKGDASCTSHRQCRGGTEVEFCKVKGMGHTWPSGSQYFPVKQIGPVSYDISFDQIWEFFERHSLKEGN